MFRILTTSLAFFLGVATAWNVRHSITAKQQVSPLSSSSLHQSPSQDRRTALAGLFTTVGLGLITAPGPANALVKGVAPPPKKSAGEKLKCTNVEECQALAETRDQESREKEEQGPPPKVTATGVRYRDIEDGNGDEVKDGDDVRLYFKVLKLGKRSFDGLSGEGTVVFSLGKRKIICIFENCQVTCAANIAAGWTGYGLEDGEDKPGSKSFKTVVGAVSNIRALNEAVVGMKVGGTRRFSILPQKGWERSVALCDGGPGGKGSGGDLKVSNGMIYP
jgi:FKBP-type peptidyl-prolyl cis-trans isomerase